jgi:hypothetical protein
MAMDCFRVTSCIRKKCALYLVLCTVNREHSSFESLTKYQEQSSKFKVERFGQAGSMLPLSPGVRYSLPRQFNQTAPSLGFCCPAGSSSQFRLHDKQL